MTWEYREFDVQQNATERSVMQRLHEGWELVGLHRKIRRSRPVIVAIMRRPSGATELQERVCEPMEMRIA